MRALGARMYTDMSGLEILEVPVPEIKDPDQMLIKMHVATFATGDAIVITGQAKLMMSKKPKFPLRVGITGSGTVVKVGQAVTAFKPGDAVYGMAFGRPMSFIPHPGYASDPSSSACGCCASRGAPAGLEGKTVFVPGALSATGNVGVQLLKHVYGASRVIATASTAKMPLVRDRLPSGTVDELVDYQKHPRLADVVAPGSVDFAYGTQWTLDYLSVMEKRRGVVVNIAALFPAQLFREIMGDVVPFWLLWIASLAQLYYRWRLRGTNIKMGVVSGNAGAREDVERVGEILATGKIQPVYTVVDMKDIEAVREATDKVQKIKGGIGALVIKIA
ncbi:uncharacterized protein PG998_011189 [Apiospora kogelbergensis]|uniref:uncharacterized protein n=1 Tax=Apiospora kogelbergensis TaxID=1337665 RepID=UPI00312E6420